MSVFSAIDFYSPGTTLIFNKNVVFPAQAENFFCRFEVENMLTLFLNNV